MDQFVGRWGLHLAHWEPFSPDFTALHPGYGGCYGIHMPELPDPRVGPRTFASFADDVGVDQEHETDSATFEIGIFADVRHTRQHFSEGAAPGFQQGCPQYLRMLGFGAATVGCSQLLECQGDLFFHIAHDEMGGHRVCLIR